MGTEGADMRKRFWVIDLGIETKKSMRGPVHPRHPEPSSGKPTNSEGLTPPPCELETIRIPLGQVICAMNSLTQNRAPLFVVHPQASAGCAGVLEGMYPAV